MNGYHIRALLLQKDITVKDIANGLGVRSQAVSQIIHGAAASRRIATAIAEAVDRPLAELFPRYRDGGK